MKNSVRIFREDLKRIFKNYGALIVVSALCILPSLYAWFNIKASWDPYGQEATSQIKIGVVNKDIGTTLKGRELNIGNELVEKLKQNNLMGWQFVSEEEAEKQIKEGKYYANITIPEDFSKNLTSIITEDIKKGEIVYTVNEKINAIAPKLTDKGVTGVQDQVSKEIVKIVSETIFSVANEVGVELENQIPKITTVYNALLQIQASFGKINETTDLAYDGALKIQELINDIQGDIPLIQETISKAKTLGEDLANYISVSKESINKIAPAIKQDIKLINEISKDISKSTEALINAINSGSEKAPEMVSNLVDKVSSIKNTTTALVNILEKLNRFSPERPLDNLIGDLNNVSSSLDSILVSLNQIKDSIDNGVKPDVTILNNIITVTNDVISISDNIYNNFDIVIIPTLNDVLNKGYEVAEEAIKILTQAEEKLPKVEEILNLSLQGVDKGKEGLDYIKTMLPKSEAMINDLVGKLSSINGDEGLNEIINLLKADVVQRSDFLTNPIEIVEHKLFPMENYGTGMTPFYTVLSLWVGVLLLVSILSVEYKGEYSITEIYFGKLFLFLLIASIQGLIVSLGDVFILNIYCSNKALFILGTVFASITFAFIVYSLVSVFGSVGQVIAIILMVLQVAGSGGTFPIQLTPHFFQVINPFLPFTYAISFAREAIGGIVMNVLIMDIGIMLIYIGVFIFMAVALKKPINKLSQGFINSFKKSGIGGH